MKILHCCLSNFYIDNYNYQENALPRQNKIDGHEVMILASTEVMVDNSQLGYTKPAEYINEDGIKVVRIPYRSFLFKPLTKKIRAYKNTMRYIEEFNPDIILFHGASSYELVNVSKYKEKNPNIKLYVDNHADFNNSAKNFISKRLLHLAFYRRLIQKSLGYIDKILCISHESFEFMKDLYDIPINKLEFYPLGGAIPEDEEYRNRRGNKRTELKLDDSDILFVHSGKMGKRKRTVELLKAFKNIEKNNHKLLLLGSIPEETKLEISRLIEEDERVKFLGWKNSEELYDYLCAADMYLQPGSQSVTMQHAICCRCPVMLYPHKSHMPYLNGNGYYVETVADMVEVFKRIEVNPKILKNMEYMSKKVADELLDYKKLAARLYI